MPVKSYWRDVTAQSSQPSSSPFVVVPGYELDLGLELNSQLRSWMQLPCLLWFQKSLFAGLDVDTIMEATSVLGTLCGVLAFVGFHHVSVFATAFVCYLSLFIMGQTFLGFQWDIFLLETGASLILYAPWWGWTAVSQPAVNWVLRAQWVRRP